MAYQIKRKKQIYEELELLNDDNSIYKKIIVDLSIDEIVKNFRNKEVELVRAQQDVKKEPDSVEKLQKVGLVLVSFFEVIFGEEQTNDILRFYKNNYTEMYSDIMPFIHETISPAIVTAVQDYKQNIAKKYNYNRNQKRKFK